MANFEKEKTHKAWAYAFQPGGKKYAPVEVGMGTIDKVTNQAHVYMNRMPIGAFTGYVQLVPIGENPKAADGEPSPKRPGENADDNEARD